ncbi:MAG: response regulator [Planctomycetota bacterium]|nr:response regulator [Planctomycetota bacterium]
MTAAGEVLIVDDDADIREALSGVLTLDGLDVVSFGDAREALGWLDQGHVPAVVLLDLMMPTMNGWEFVQELTRRPALTGLPVIVLTGAAESGGLHVRSLLKKPVDLDVLLGEVRRWTGNGAPG